MEQIKNFRIIGIEIERQTKTENLLRGFRKNLGAILW